VVTATLRPAAALDVPASRVISAARAAADAWWGFLDDRESAAAPRMANSDWPYLQ